MPDCPNAAALKGTFKNRCIAHGGGQRCERCNQALSKHRRKKHGAGGNLCYMCSMPTWANPFDDITTRPSASRCMYDEVHEVVAHGAREIIVNAALDQWLAAANQRYRVDRTRFYAMRRIGKRVNHTRFEPDWSALIVVESDGVRIPVCHLFVETDEGGHDEEQRDDHQLRMRKVARCANHEKETRYGTLFVRLNPDQSRMWKQFLRDRLNMLTTWLTTILDDWSARCVSTRDAASASLLHA